MVNLLGPGAAPQARDLESRMGEARVTPVVDRQLGDAARVRAQAIRFEAGVAPRQRRDSGPLDRTNHGQRTSPCVSCAADTKDTLRGYNLDWPSFISGGVQGSPPPVNGAGGGNRTLDHSLTKRMLCR